MKTDDLRRGVGRICERIWERGIVWRHGGGKRKENRVWVKMETCEGRKGQGRRSMGRHKEINYPALP